LVIPGVCVNIAREHLLYVLGCETVKREIALPGVPYFGEWNRDYTKEDKLNMVYLK
jgi:hypothetical protein